MSDPRIAQQFRQVPLIVTIAQDSNLRIGQQLFAGSKWLTGPNGYASLAFFYSVGSHISGACNDAEVIRSHILPNGAYRVSIYTQQRFGCLVPWSSWINAKTLTNSDSAISLISLGQEARITGTQIGGMAGPRPDSVLFATAEGTMTAIASNGDKAPVPAGWMAEVSPRGIKRTRIPKPSYSIVWFGDYAVFSSPTGIQLKVDGQPYAPGTKVYLPRQVTAISIGNVRRSWPLTPPWWINRGQR